MGLSISEIDKCDTLNRPSDDCDDTCTTMLMTLCVSVMSVHIAKTSQTCKDKPSKSPEPDSKHGITINMPKKTVAPTSEREQDL